ncbi:hypothetical protein D3C72_1511760 [compost metagenome]
MAAKKPAQAAFRRPHMASGRVTCFSIMARIRFLRQPMTEPTSVTANSQYSTVGFHLMKVSLCNRMVAPPNTPMISRLTHCIGSTLPWRKRTQAIWNTVAIIATAVAG